LPERVKSGRQTDPYNAAELKRFTPVNKESAEKLLATAERKQVLFQENSMMKEFR
jgi:hypothetical protein